MVSRAVHFAAKHIFLFIIDIDYVSSLLRYSKMVEWMDNVEMAISKVCASKVYTSAEFKREKDNFQSLCKNLERAETKK